MTDLVLSVDSVTVRLSVPKAVALPVRGILDASGELPSVAAPITDLPRALPVSVEPQPTAKPGGVTIAQTAALITDPYTGKYPKKDPFRDELLRALAFAAEVWGADTTWEAIDDLAWTKLLRLRCEQLVANGYKAVRATEITVGRLLTVVGWLRDTKRIARDAAQWPREWKKDIAKHWKATTGSDRDPQPERQRYTVAEFQRILSKADFDPRLSLLLRLAVGLRPGQVARARRSDLKLPPIIQQRDERGNDVTNYGVFTVHGAGKKGGGAVYLTRGQRQCVDNALSGDGYLAHVEDEYQRKERAEYRLFPRGYTVGRVGMLRGQETKLSLSEHVDFNRHVSGSWIRKSWRTAEQRAGIAHIEGRCTYGQRRLTVDVGVKSGLSPSGIKGLGLWADADMPLNVYAEEANSAGSFEARPIRAQMLGEST